MSGRVVHRYYKMELLAIGKIRYLNMVITYANKIDPSKCH